MKFSASGRHLLGGVGDGRILIDGHVPEPLRDLHAGGWAWLSEDVIFGNAWRNGGWRLTAYDLVTGRVHALDSRGASNVHAGAGRWLAYLADGVTGSFDSEGHDWPDRVAIGMSPEGEQLFTNAEHVGLIVRHADGHEDTHDTGPIESIQMAGGVILYESAGALHAIGASSPLSPIGAEVALFTTRPGGSRWLVSWNEAHRTLAVYPWQDSAPLVGYALSGDERDFNPDIASRADGLLVVGTGVNSGETGQRLYEIDLVAGVFRRDGGDWHPLESVDLSRAPAPTLPAVQPFQHHPRIGAFFVTSRQYGSFDCPGNIEILIRGNYGAMLRARKVIADMTCVASVPDGQLVGIWCGFEGGHVTSENSAEYSAAILESIRRAVPPIVYFDSVLEYPDEILDRYVAPVPDAIPCFCAYPVKVGGQLEPVDVTLARHRRTAEKLCRRFPRVAMAWPMYTQSGNWPADHVLAMQDGLASIARDLGIWGLLAFAYGRDQANAIPGLKLEPYLQQLVDACRGEEPPILLADDAPTRPTPEPQHPEPSPVDPSPAAPLPEETEMNLPARCYALLHNSNIAALVPGETDVRLAYESQEYGSYQEIEVTKSKDWTREETRVLVRFTGGNRLFRVEKNLAREKKYDECVQTRAVDAVNEHGEPDADSSWQQGIAAGPFIHFTGDSEDRSRHGVLYTLTCVDKDGRLFR